MTLTDIPKCPHDSTRSGDDWPTRRKKTRRRNSRRRPPTTQPTTTRLESQ